MLSLILFIIILGAIVAVHEFGHFIFAKFSNTYVYEFAIGMGKKIWGKKRKGGETEFSIRAIPLGGYCMIAGEDTQDDGIPKDRQMCNKSFIQRFMVLFAGPLNNFIFAFLILLISAFIFGAMSMKPYIGELKENYPAYSSGIQSGDLLLELDGTKVSSWDRALLILQTNNGSAMKFKVQKADGSIAEYDITPAVEEIDGVKSYKFGIATYAVREYGFVASIKYAFTKTGALFVSMFDSIKYLFTGKVSVKQLSGPVGIYSVVDSQSKEGLESILYLVAYLSINVGFINLLPFPAFDGGRILFLLIEKIFKKPVSKEVENTIHSIGFILIILLLVYVTFNDIIKLIH